MSIADLLSGIAAAFGFVFLAWALLRPEDF
jgi:hypothetical protein